VSGPEDLTPEQLAVVDRVRSDCFAWACQAQVFGQRSGPEEGQRLAGRVAEEFRKAGVPCIRGEWDEDEGHVNLEFVEPVGFG
jgi:hypothetical protein